MYHGKISYTIASRCTCPYFHGSVRKGDHLNLSRRYQANFPTQPTKYTLISHKAKYHVSARNLVSKSEIQDIIKGTEELDFEAQAAKDSEEAQRKYLEDKKEIDAAMEEDLKFIFQDDLDEDDLEQIKSMLENDVSGLGGNDGTLIFPTRISTKFSQKEVKEDKKETQEEKKSTEEEEYTETPRQFQVRMKRIAVKRWLYFGVALVQFGITIAVVYAYYSWRFDAETTMNPELERLMMLKRSKEHAGQPELAFEASDLDDLLSEFITVPVPNPDKAVEKETEKVVEEESAPISDKHFGYKVEVVRAGYGLLNPEEGDVVSLHYVGKLEDGTVFDDSRARNKPLQFVVGKGRVIKGWELAIQEMTEGELATVICQPHMAYGEKGLGAVIPPNATVIFEIELLALQKM